LSGYTPEERDLATLMRGTQLLPPLHMLLADVQPEVEQLILRGTAQQPAARPTADEVLALLDGLLHRPTIPPAPAPARLPLIGVLVGREAELEMYPGVLRSTGLALIVGPAGIGKTTLAAAIAQQLAAERSVFWHTFRAGEQVEALIWALAGFLAWQQREDVWHLLQGAVQTGGQLPPTEVLIDYLVQLLRDGAYLLCFDEMQYVDNDPGPARLVERLLRERTDNGVQVIVTGRRMPAFVRHEPPALSGLHNVKRDRQ
jgi:predicted ATPase